MSVLTPPIAVFDCMLYLQSTISPSGPAAACLRRVEDGHVRLVVSFDILKEIRDVLSRPKIRQRNTELTDELVDAFLSRIASLAPPREHVPALFQYSRDPKDEPYINLALAENAAYLVSHDNDLLDLMKDDNADGKRLRSQAPNLIVLSPPSFLLALPPPAP